MSNESLQSRAISLFSYLRELPQLRSSTIRDLNAYDLTSWVKYFTALLSEVFARAKEETLQYAKKGIPVEPEKLRRLDRRARMVLGLFAGKDRIAAEDMAKVLGLSNRMVRLLAQKWVKSGWLIIVDKSNRARAYGLSAIYRQFVG